MNFCQLNTFFLTFWPVCCVSAANRPKSEEKSVQLAEVHLYRSYFLQYPYFSTSKIKFMFSKKAPKIDALFTVDSTLCNKCQW